jgi:hypothetical protein
MSAVGGDVDHRERWQPPARTPRNVPSLGLPAQIDVGDQRPAFAAELSEQRLSLLG